MKLDHLKYFVAAAHHGSFTSAGLHMNISPTSIGYAVGILEDQLQTALFVRKPSRGLTVTADGKLLLQQCRQLLTEFEAIEGQFKGPQNQFRGELVVGGQEGLIWSLLPRAITRLGVSHPELRISMTMTPLGTNFDSLENGDTDVLITFRADDSGPPNCDVTKLCQPSICVMMREGHPLDKEGDTVLLSDVAEYPQIVNNEPAALNLALDAFRNVGKLPEVYFSSNVSAGAQALVGQSDSVSIRYLRPSSAFSPLGHRLVYKRVENVGVNPFLVAAKIKSRTPSIRNKRDLMIDVCRDLFASGEMKAHLFYD